MSTVSLDKQTHKYTVDNIMRWLLFGILIVVVPPLFHIWFRIIVGLTVDYVEYVPDMLLIVLSVCCNLINICVDSEKKIAYLLRWILGIILGLISIGCWGLFFAVRFSPKNLLSKESYKEAAQILFYFSSGLIFCCAIIGFIIEYYTAKKQRNNNLEVNNAK